MSQESKHETEVYRVRDLIAAHIACEKECQENPTGCGCALTAARAVVGVSAKGWTGDAELGAPVRSYASTFSGVEVAKQMLAGTPAQRSDDNDPTASEEWNEGCNFAMVRLCEFLGVDPSSVSWDAATETVEGDVDAVLGNILRAKFGEDWGPNDVPAERQPAKQAYSAEMILRSYETDLRRVMGNGNYADLEAAVLRAPANTNRDEVARIIDGVAFRPQHINGPFNSETEKEKWFRARNVAYYKADQIVGRQSPTASASDIERAFTDVCDELGCKYDNEAALEAIVALKRQSPAASAEEAPEGWEPAGYRHDRKSNSLQRIRSSAASRHSPAVKGIEAINEPEPLVDVLPDGRCVPAINDDALWALASELHSNVDPELRPMSWSDFSPEQIERLRHAAKVFLGRFLLQPEIVDLTNHHNALLCPYCNPKGLKLEEPRG